MTARDDHLTPQQVLRLLALMQETDAVVVGGQSVNLWAHHYLPRVPELAAYAPFTSKDIDFYGTRRTAEHLAKVLDGQLYVPDLGDVTPNAAMVVARLDDRRIQIDFMAAVLGVEDRAITNNYVVLEGREPTSGQQIRVVLMHPLDCLRSRLANINVLGRHDAHSVNQAKAAVLIARAFIHDLLDQGECRLAQTMLHDLYFVSRDSSVGKPSNVRHGIDPSAILAGFRDDERLDPRWRERNLATAIQRLGEKYAAAAKRLLGRPPSEPR